jgi:hypothetical protein
VKACGGDGPDLSSDTAVQAPVPLVSTYTPTPRATAADSASPSGDPAAADALPGNTVTSDPGIADDPSQPYTPGGDDPCADPSVAPTMTDESGAPLCDGTSVASLKPTSTPTPTPRPTYGPTPTPKVKTPTPTPTPASDAAAAGPIKCANSVLSVRLKTDRDAYTAKQKPKLYLGVKNSGPVDCLVDLGSKALSFTITSGNDRIWSSDDCQGKGTSDVRVLKAGQTLWARSVWSQVRSRPGCPSGMPKAKAGYYRVEGSAGGVKADRRAVFQLK